MQACVMCDETRCRRRCERSCRGHLERRPSAEHPQGRVGTPGRVFSLAIWSSCGWVICEKSMPFRPSSFFGHATTQPSHPPSQTCVATTSNWRNRSKPNRREPTACFANFGLQIGLQRAAWHPPIAQKAREIGLLLIGETGVGGGG
jgi:hypothetical protein